MVDETVKFLENVEIRNWDHYYYLLSILIGQNSKCLSRKIGAILVKDKSIISTGYNGPPRGVPHCGDRLNPSKTKMVDENLHDCLRSKYFIDVIDNPNPFDFEYKENICPRQQLSYGSGGGLEFCIAGHAERNTLLNASRNGISTFGTTMYMSCGVPCKDCLIEIINAGVKEVVVIDKNKFYDQTSKYILYNSDLEIRNYGY